MAPPTTFTLALTLHEILLGLALVLVFCLIIVFNMIGPVLSLYIQARVSGTPVSLFQLVRMRQRNEHAREIVLSMIRLRIARVTDVRLDDVRAHAAAGGDVIRVANALIAASGARLRPTWSQVAAADLAELKDELAEPSSEVGRRLSGIVGSRAVARSLVLPIYKGEVSLNGRTYRARAACLGIPEGAQVEVTGFRSSGTLVVNYHPDLEADG